MRELRAAHAPDTYLDTMRQRRNAPLVLLAEDDADLRVIFGNWLRQMGLDVREAADGLQALAVLDSEVPALVVLDLKLPYISGTDILAELEAHDSTQAIPVIVVTGTLARPANRNVWCRASKPVTCEQLTLLVERCLRARHK